MWHRYPTYRWDIARGRVCREDRSLGRAVEAAIREQVAELKPRLVLAPLGFGRHVDHLIVRDAAAALVPVLGTSATVAFYSDFPYALREPCDERFVRRHALVRVDFAEASAQKVNLIRRYRTQADALYPTGVPESADELWWPPSVSPPEVLAVLTRQLG
jgi:LmbE family N-acetylglucosaminyl deacetylase